MNILWFDIETAGEIDNKQRDGYIKKDQWIKKMEDKGLGIDYDSYLESCGIYPEFSKVVCISMCIGENTKSLIGEEKDILNEFNSILEKSTNYILGGFNIIGFDIPYIWKRMIINGIKPNNKLCIQNQKPREVNVIDVMKIRQHTSFGCSLDLLCITLFNETPKTNMLGSNVGKEYYKGNIEGIKKYCEADITFTARCYEFISKTM